MLPQNLNVDVERKGRVGDMNCTGIVQYSTVVCTMSFFSSPPHLTAYSGCYSSDARGMLYRNRIGIRVKAPQCTKGLTSSGASVLYCAVSI